LTLGLIPGCGSVVGAPLVLQSESTELILIGSGCPPLGGVIVHVELLRGRDAHPELIVVIAAAAAVVPLTCLLLTVVVP
jgi:hypothetical protein